MWKMSIVGKEYLLNDLKGKGLLTFEEVITCLEQLVPAFVPKQVRHKVTDIPDKRTIRYYIGQGLIEKPIRSGHFALFNCRHVLQLLTIKYLQSQYYPLRKISEITKNSADQDLELILLGRKTRVHELNDSSLDYGTKSWRKFKIDEKLEFYVEESFNIADVDRGVEGISGEIYRILRTFGQESGYTQLGEPSNNRMWIKNLDLEFLEPASPLRDLSSAVIALITEGGLVPKGNPDKLEEANSPRYLKYHLGDLADLRQGEFESIDAGWDESFVNLDPNRLLPLDVMRDLEREKYIRKIHEYFFTTTGVATPVGRCRDMGRRIAAELHKDGVSAAILTAT